MVEPLFQIQVQCPQCEAGFKTSRVRPSFKKPVKTDTDFCLHYKEINPDYYVVRICPHCGFASTENSKSKLTPPQKLVFQEKIGAQWTFKEYGGERRWEDALYAYKLALVCAQTVNEQARLTAGLLHQIAWLYRSKGDDEQESRFLRYALAEYIRAFETEAGEMNNARLMYLIGELHRRLDEFNEAVKWFSRVVNDKRIMDAGMIQACREQWQAVREEMEERKLQLSEDVQGK